MIQDMEQMIPTSALPIKCSLVPSLWSWIAFSENTRVPHSREGGLCYRKICLQL